MGEGKGGSYFALEDKHKLKRFKCSVVRREVIRTMGPITALRRCSYPRPAIAWMSKMVPMAPRPT